MSYLKQKQIRKIKQIKSLFLCSLFFYGLITPIFISLFLSLIYFVDNNNVTQYHVIATISIYLGSIILMVLIPTMINLEKLRIYRKNNSYRNFTKYIFAFFGSSSLKNDNFLLDYFKFLFKFMVQTLLILLLFVFAFAFYFLINLVFFNFSYYAIWFLIIYFLVWFIMVLIILVLLVNFHKAVITWSNLK